MPQPILAKFYQEILAEMAGTTRSRVSLFMNKPRKLGFISYNGGLEVHSSLLNIVLHDAEVGLKEGRDCGRRNPPNQTWFNWELAFVVAMARSNSTFARNPSRSRWTTATASLFSAGQ
jgi:hypothetical protein